MSHECVLRSEHDRLHALHRTVLLDTPIEDRFERITRLTRTILNTPMAALSLVDENRQWFKSVQGVHLTETPRGVSFCTHAIQQSGVFEVRDATTDERFKDNPLVTGEPHIVFYAGHPVRTREGHALGALCVADRKPRALEAWELEALEDLAALTEAVIDARESMPLQHEMLAQMAMQDRSLLIDRATRVWNREGIMDMARAHRAASVAEGTGTAVIMVGETGNGHDRPDAGASDESLRTVAKLLSRAIRGCDAVGRWNRSTFMITLAGVCETETRLVTGKISCYLAAADVGDVCVGCCFAPASEDVEVEYMERAAVQAMADPKSQGCVAVIGGGRLAA